MSSTHQFNVTLLSGLYVKLSKLELLFTFLSQGKAKSSQKIHWTYYDILLASLTTVLNDFSMAIITFLI